MGGGTGAEAHKVVNFDYSVDVKPSPSPWMIVTYPSPPGKSSGSHPHPIPLTLRSPSPPRDQPAQRVYSQSDEEGKYQVPQHNTGQHTRAHHRAVAFWECIWHRSQGRSMGVGNWEAVSGGGGFEEIWEEMGRSFRNREGYFRV